jgi:hypothetical protein
MPGSADTAAGAAIFIGITKEATINIAAKTPRMLGSLVFIIPPDFIKPVKHFQGLSQDPVLSWREPPAKIFDLLAREFLRITITGGNGCYPAWHLEPAMPRLSPWYRRFAPGSGPNVILASCRTYSLLRPF